MTRNGGFTLIELMVVVAVIAILAAVAVPSYQQFQIRATRSAAQQFMLDIATHQKQHLLDARTYVAVDDNAHVAAWNALDLVIPPEVAEFYEISVATTSTPATFAITAEPKSGTRQAGDGDLTLDQRGAKSANW